MKAHLCHEDRDFNLDSGLPAHADDLIQDLELVTLFQAMAHGDKFLYEVSKRAVFSSLESPQEIVYRQHVLNDCIAQPDEIRELYKIAVDAITGERKSYRTSLKYPSAVLRVSIESLRMFVEHLQRLRQMAENDAGKFHSEGLTTFFAMLKENLDDEYFATIDDHLKRLKFKDGTAISAELGIGNKGARYVLHRPSHLRRSWKERLGIGPRTSYTFEIAPRDDAGHRALVELADRGVNLVANALAQSADHIAAFFSMLAPEIGFYVACLNLHDQLGAKGVPVCTPVPVPWNPPALSFDGLYDVCLALKTDTPVVGNAANADAKSLVMITGANSGGKSTFLRSTGLAQLMMQAGMFVGADSFRASACDGLFTHFIREEDASMTSGKLDEELSRMSAMADQLSSRSLVLFNESFAATNEREGSEIARQIVSALLESGIKVIFVTHQFTLADGFAREQGDRALFLLAERHDDGRRSFKVIEGTPLPTSYGEDIYERIGGWAAEVS